MEKVSIAITPFTPLVLDIGGEEVYLQVKTSTNSLGPLSQLCFKTGEDLEPLDEQRVQAIQTRDFEALRHVDGKIAELLEPVLISAIGKAGWERVLVALGAGKRAEPSDCVEPLTQILNAISLVVRDHFGISAAQTTAGAVENALQTADHN